jgi:hypothetical protein
MEDRGCGKINNYIIDKGSRSILGDLIGINGCNTPGLFF